MMAGCTTFRLYDFFIGKHRWIVKKYAPIVLFFVFLANLLPRIHRHIGESVGFSIFLARNMGKSNLTSPFGDDCLNLEKYFFEVGIFDLVVPRKLLDRELTIRKERNLACAKFDGASDAKKYRRVFCDIVRRGSDILVAFFDGTTIRIREENPTSRDTGIAARTAVSVDTYFFIHRRQYNQSEKIPACYSG